MHEVTVWTASAPRCPCCDMAVPAATWLPRRGSASIHAGTASSLQDLAIYFGPRGPQEWRDQTHDEETHEPDPYGGLLMARLTAHDFDQELLVLFDAYVHG